jgi:hypothetical protein
LNLKENCFEEIFLRNVLRNDDNVDEDDADDYDEH